MQASGNVHSRCCCSAVQSATASRSAPRQFKRAHRGQLLRRAASQGGSIAALCKNSCCILCGHNHRAPGQVRSLRRLVHQANNHRHMQRPAAEATAAAGAASPSASVIDAKEARAFAGPNAPAVGVGRIAPIQHPCRGNARRVAASRAHAGLDNAGVSAHQSGAESVQQQQQQQQPRKSRRVVVLGGTGRVGSSTASALLRQLGADGVQLVLGSKDTASFARAQERRPELHAAQSLVCDVRQPKQIAEAIKGADLVVHTAGPFQGASSYTVLEAAIQMKVPYIDVCDDSEYAKGAKRRFHEAAVGAGVPAIVTGGIYPGTSNVMAAHMLSIARKEYADDEDATTAPTGDALEAQRLRYSYYTAGSGSAGPTILETTFLLAGQPCNVYRDGKLYQARPISDRRDVDFGKGIGHKGLYLYNLPEVDSSFEYLKVPSVSARFGTDPPFWNWGMWLLARIAPKSLLESRAGVKILGGLLYPVVQLVDKVAGEAVAMKLELEFKGGKSAGGVFIHMKLSEAMGNSVAAFAGAILENGTAPGVWFPEQRQAIKDRAKFLQRASAGCYRFAVNKPIFTLESEVRQLGGLIYW